LRKFGVLFLLLMPAHLFADEVVLKGGAKFVGKITEQTSEKITIDIGDGVVGVPLARVESVKRGRSSLEEYQERAAKLGQEDLQGWRSLGRWARAEGLSAQTRQAYERVLALAHDDTEARQALGYVQVQGQWMTEEESYRARGFVKYQGEWMTPAEVQLEQSSAAAAQAREDAEDRARQADVDKLQEQARAAKAEKDAKWEESTQSWDFPAWGGGGWGYGVSGWPSTTNVTWRNGSNPHVPNVGPPK
jgi:hypothetical protein